MDRLPTEILLLIAEHIDDLRTLRDLILCSRRLHSVFLPLMYGMIDLEDVRPKYPSNTFQKVMIPLIHNICRHKAAARSIYDLKCSASRFRFDRSSDVTFVDPDVVLDHALIRGVLDEICDTEQEKSMWMSHLAASNKDAWTALLLTRLSHLETINISEPCENVPFLQEVLEKAARQQRPFNESPPFPFLQEVNIGCDDDYLWGHGDFVLPFFYFPGVRKITAIDLQIMVERSSFGYTEGNLSHAPSH